MDVERKKYTFNTRKNSEHTSNWSCTILNVWLKENILNSIQLNVKIHTNHLFNWVNSENYPKCSGSKLLKLLKTKTRKSHLIFGAWLHCLPDFIKPLTITIKCNCKHCNCKLCETQPHCFVFGDLVGGSGKSWQQQYMTKQHFSFSKVIS